MEPDGGSPLRGHRIVVTRSVEDNRTLADRLGGLGAEVVELPLIEAVPPDDGGAALAGAIERLADYRWVVLTSVSGVRAVAAALGSRPWPEGVTVAPVGPTTEAAARAAGMATVAAPDVATAAELASTFPTWDGTGGKRVLAPLAELAGETVVDGLAERGWSVDRVTAYRTVEPDQTGESDASTVGASAVAFFSPSAVDRYVDRFGQGGAPAVVVCIGPSTAGRAAERGLSAVVAEPHTERGVVDALLDSLGPTGPAR